MTDRGWPGNADPQGAVVGLYVSMFVLGVVAGGTAVGAVLALVVC